MPFEVVVGMVDRRHLLPLVAFVVALALLVSLQHPLIVLIDGRHRGYEKQHGCQRPDLEGNGHDCRSIASSSCRSFQTASTTL